MRLSALKGDGVDRFWDAVSDFRRLQTGSGALATRRRAQSLTWMWEQIEAGLKHDFREQPAVRQLLPAITADVAAGRLPASTAARRLLESCRPGLDPGSAQARHDLDAGSTPA
jgi:LAO/AO transport system kinase